MHCPNIATVLTSATIFRQVLTSATIFRQVLLVQLVSLPAVVRQNC